MEESRRRLQVGAQLVLLCSLARHRRDRSIATVSRYVLDQVVLGLPSVMSSWLNAFRGLPEV